MLLHKCFKQQLKRGALQKGYEALSRMDETGSLLQVIGRNTFNNISKNAEKDYAEIIRKGLFTTFFLLLLAKVWFFLNIIIIIIFERKKAKSTIVQKSRQ